MVSPRRELQTRAEQRMVLRPRMLRSVSVLALSSADLGELVEREARENEALRLRPRAHGGGGAAADGERARRPLESRPATEGGLRADLEEQLVMLEGSPADRAWVRLCVDSLDGRGYLSLGDEELLELGRREGLGADRSALARAIATLQRFEPRGIGGRDLVEALLLQLDLTDADYPPLCRLVEEFLDEIAARRLAGVASALAVEDAELERLLAVLRTLDPRPGAGLAGEPHARVIAPDLVAEPGEGGWNLRVEGSLLPTLEVAPEAARGAGEGERDPGERRWRAEARERARELVEAVRRREETLLRVARAALERQHAFLEHGAGHLVPLSMAKVAEDLGLAQSTVSRTVAGKHLQTPMGVVALRALFQAAGGSGGEATPGELASAVREVLEAEDPSRPLSDDEIARALAGRGLPLARRTVAAYRRRLGIPSSYRRRHGG
ncbi:MAG: RNA polymerase factor sigma-54 [Planctomycetota bacterium]|jgi:RNA polymerase sigma-54 factor|nr:RNA polymerase factor sigma-54 [Planctomycetota bacterium]